MPRSSGCLSPRPLMPGEIDHEALWLCVSAVVLLGGAWWLQSGYPFPQCVFHEWTGVACPTCGSTRAFTSLLRGDLPAALKWNPLVTAGFAGMLVFNLYAAAALAFRLPRLRPSGFDDARRRMVRLGAAALILLNWAYVIATLP